MSGFVALFNLDGAPIDAEPLQQMTAYQAFRGPDAQQCWMDGRVGLGHALLRTTLEQAQEQQPCSLDNCVWIAGDVRLDGRAELLRSLRAGNRTVADAAPDVELLLHAYQLWGEQCLERLSGDFAFALWDVLQRRLFCARDQLGIAPLYYAQAGQTLIVSNTLNVCLLHPQVSDQLNEQAVADFLLFGMNYEWETTIFAGIQRLPPAHTLTWAEGTMRTRRYWALPEDNEYLHYRRKEEYVEQFLQLFEQAVADRLRTGKVLAEMSGGLDSPSVVAVAHQLLTAAGRPFDLRVLTYVTDRAVPAQAERGFAQTAAQFIGLTQHELIEEAGMMTPVEAPRYLPGEPMDNQTVDVEALTNRPAGQYRVALTGLGGDPGFLGSSLYWRELLKRGEVMPLLRNAWWHAQLHRRLPPLWVRTTLGLPLYLRRRTAPALAFPEFLDPELVTQHQLRERYAQVWTAKVSGGPQREVVATPFWTNVFGACDPGQTGVGVKYRHPFFDLRLVRFLLVVPRVPWCFEKKLLRVAMQGRLPAALLQRPKTAAGNVADFKLPQQTLAWLAPLTWERALQPYVVGEKLLTSVQSLAELDSSAYHCIPHALALAYWLRHWQRPTAGGSGMTQSAPTAAAVG